MKDTGMERRKVGEKRHTGHISCLLYSVLKSTHESLSSTQICIKVSPALRILIKFFFFVGPLDRLISSRVLGSYCN